MRMALREKNMSRHASSNLEPAVIGEILVRLMDNIRLFSERNVLELIGVLEGVKEVVRVPVTIREWQILRAGCEHLGLVIRHANFKLAVMRTTRVGDTFTANVQWDDPAGQEFPAYIARSRETVQRALDIETAADNDALIGRLYQYPECCIRAYAEIAQGLSWVESLVHSARSSWQERAANKLAYLFDGGSLFPDYFPCTLSCQKTIKLTEMYRTLLKRYCLGDLAESLWERMGRPVLVGHGVAYQFANSRLELDTLLFDPDAVRRCSWNDDDSDPLGSSEFVHVRKEGPWLRAVWEEQAVGTLFMFKERDLS